MVFCYLDRTFCISACAVDGEDCASKLTPQVEKKAQEWWRSIFPNSPLEETPPISQACLADGCHIYKPIHDDNE